MYIAKTKNEKEFSIWGSGKPKREFLYVDELSDCINFLLDKETDNDLYNVGSGQEVTIEELSYQIKSVIKYEGNLIFDTSMPDGNPRKLLDSSLINELGWESKINLSAGLNKTYKWYLDNLDKIRN